MSEHTLFRLASLTLLLIIWQCLALWSQSPLIPSPAAVVSVMLQDLENGRLSLHLSATLTRLTAAFLLSMIIGSGVGIVLGRHPRLDRFFDSWLTIALNTPALVSIILCYLWFGLNETAAILAVFINKVPNVIVILREGTRHAHGELLEVAAVFRFGRLKTLRHVLWPPLFPYVMTAARTGLALIWKIVLVVELLGRSNGMGYQIHLFFQMFDVAGILAYTLAFIALIQSIEWLILTPLDRSASRWRT